MKLMKKMLALSLSVSMLSGMCVFAEETADAHSYTLSDVTVVSGDQTFDFSNLSIGIDIPEEENGALLHLDENGETAAEVGVTMTDGIYVLHLDSNMLGHKDFGVDPVVVIERALQGGIDGLISVLEDIDVHSAAQDIADFLQDPSALKAELETEKETESYMKIPDVSVDGDFMAVLEDCVSEPETVTVDGDEYTMTTFTYDMDHIGQILDMIRIDGEQFDVSGALREAGVEFSFTGTFYENDERQMGDVSGTYDDGEQSGSCQASYDTSIAGDDTSTVYTIDTAWTGQPDVSITFTVSDGVSENSGFTADSVDMDNVVILTDMEDEEAVATLTETLSTLAGETMGLVLAPVMEVLLADVNLEALEAMQTEMVTE